MVEPEMTAPQLPKASGKTRFVIGAIIVALFIMAAIQQCANASSGPGIPVPLVAPQISLIGDLQNRGLIPMGFVPAKDGVSVRKFSFGVLGFMFPHYAICLTSTRYDRAVMVISDVNLTRWLIGRVDHPIMTTGMCEIAWDQCWPGDPPSCPSD